MNATDKAAGISVAADTSRSHATSAQARIHWAAAAANKPEAAEAKVAAANAPEAARKSVLEQKFEAMRDRNWVTERMVEQYQKHWQCSREAALERLLSKTGS